MFQFRVNECVNYASVAIADGASASAPCELGIVDAWSTNRKLSINRLAGNVELGFQRTDRSQLTSSVAGGSARAVVVERSSTLGRRRHAVSLQIRLVSAFRACLISDIVSCLGRSRHGRTPLRRQPQSRSASKIALISTRRPRPWSSPMYRTTAMSNTITHHCRHCIESI